jgi:DNA-binding transcriptional ArsR family regulator
MGEDLRRLLDRLYQEGLDHDVAESDRLRRRRNLEPDAAALVSIVVQAMGATQMVEVGTSSFHIMDPDWGHVVIKISGHPPFGAQIILNGHNYVARRAERAGIGYRKEGNCFTIVDDPARLARVAEALSRPAAIGRLRQVCDRWIYTSVLCFALDRSEQEAAAARYGYSVYQVEYSRNLLFRDGAVMDQVFDRVVDRTRSRLDVPRLKTLFGAKARPHRDRKKPATLAAVVETQSYDLTWFKVTFGCLGLKAYTKGERVLRIEATCHNAAELGCGRILERLPDIIGRLGTMAGRFCDTLDATTVGFLSEGILEQLPRSAQLGRTRVGGISLDSPRSRQVLAAVAALSPSPNGFTVGNLAAKVHATTGQTETDYSVRQAAYDLRKLRAHNLVVKPGRSRRYHVPTQAIRTIVAITTLRDQVLEPLLGGLNNQPTSPNPGTWTAVEHDYETLRLEMQTLFDDLGIVTPTTLKAA